MIVKKAILGGKEDTEAMEFHDALALECLGLALEEDSTQQLVSILLVNARYIEPR